MRSELRQSLYALVAGRVRFGVPLSRYTSFRIGGPADAFVEPQSVAELQALVSLLRREAIPYFVLGGGTNILVSDKGVRGVVIRLGAGFNYTRWGAEGERGHVRVGAARPLGRFVREAVARGYGGVEFAEGIPGSVGGGLLMNAGAFGGELGRVVERIVGVSPGGECWELSREELGFAYRRTALPEGFIVTEVHFSLWPVPQAHLQMAMEQAQRRRQQTQPYGYPNAGSIFKNPPGAHAGRLIEAAGLKGLTVGRAQVSEKHANFIVNIGGATASEVRQLAEQVRQVVWERMRVWLEPEIRFVGEW
ncbi:MAG: UDP-N-acetylmuramate dehydrogenase [Candidatus Binatia bacterium]|nr:UDP-N-acetylmuramate dehydrogenase [Candidatus Binatia bacterium]